MSCKQKGVERGIYCWQRDEGLFLFRADAALSMVYNSVKSKNTALYKMNDSMVFYIIVNGIKN